MARRTTPSQAQFLRDTKEHVLEIRRDDGLFRNLRLQKPGTCHLYFDITTWPGFLCVSGDMGCYVFARIPDMFEFFRAGENRTGARKGCKLPINLGYWHEKVQAECRHNPVEKWSATKFKRQINSYMFERGWPKSVRESVKEDVLVYEHEGEHFFTHAAYEFRAEYNGKHYSFEDLWDYGDARVYSYQYVWCCYAIVWAIQQYDAR